MSHGRRRSWFRACAIAVLAAAIAPLGPGVAGHSGSHTVDRPVGAVTLRSGGWTDWNESIETEDEQGSLEQLLLFWRHDGASAGEDLATAGYGYGGAAALVRRCTREIIRTTDRPTLGEKQCTETIWRAQLGDPGVIIAIDPAGSTATLLATLRGPAGECRVEITWHAVWPSQPRAEVGTDGGARTEINSTASAFTTGTNSCWKHGSSFLGIGRIWRASDVAITP